MSDNLMYGYSTKRINVKHCGAVGNGITDDTTAIMYAVDALEDGGTLYFPAGKYIITSTKKNSSVILIKNKNNITFELDKAATIKLAKTDYNIVYLVQFLNCNNIEWCGGNIEGERNEHTNITYTDAGRITGAGHYGLRVRNCSNVKISNLSMTNVYGNGIGIAHDNEQPQNENILIENCNIHDITCNGVVISGTKEWIFRNCHIYNQTGGVVTYGIDVEGHSSVLVEDGLIDGCYFHDSDTGSICVSNKARRTVIRNCRCGDRILNAVGSTDTTIENTIVDDYISVRNRITIKKSSCTHLMVAADNTSGLNLETELNMYDSVISGPASEPTIQFVTSSSDLRANACFYNCEFNFLGNTSYPLLYVLANSTRNITFEGCSFNLYPTTADFATANPISGDFIIKNCVFTTKGETLVGRLCMLKTAGNIIFSNNIIDMTSLTSYGKAIVISCAASGASLTNNTFIANSSLCDNLFGCTGITDKLIISGNIAQSWSGLTTKSTTAEYLEYNNILSTTIDNSIFDEWHFILEDDSTLTKGVLANG